MAKNLSRIVSKAITDETAEDTSSHGKHGHVKSIPGDYNGHTRKSINADFRASYKHLGEKRFSPFFLSFLLLSGSIKVIN